MVEVVSSCDHSKSGGPINSRFVIVEKNERKVASSLSGSPSCPTASMERLESEIRWSMGGHVVSTNRTLEISNELRLGAAAKSDWSIPNSSCGDLSSQLEARPSKFRI